VSNVLVSLAENGLLAGAVWLALAHPLLALGAALVALAVAVAVTAWFARRAWAAIGRVRAAGR
jgi:predicted aconitase with swiveling domain